MNKFICGFMCGILFFFIGGCTSIFKKNEGVFGKSSESIKNIDTNVRNIENAQAQSNENRLNHIGAWSAGGVDYSLSQIKTNIPKEVVVAQEMNDRIMALAGKPDFNEVQEIKNIVDKLLSQISETRADGEKLLTIKDKQIEKLEKDVKDLTYQREEEIAGAFAKANEVALKADQYKATLNQMDSFFGGGAIFYGIKKFIISASWILGIGSILFLILRIVSASNPIAGAIFSIFEQIISWFVNMIKIIAPRSINFSGFVESKTFDSYKTTLKHLIDTIQLLKEKETFDKKFTIDELMVELDKVMDSDDKDRVKLIKRELNWK